MYSINAKKVVPYRTWRELYMIVHTENVLLKGRCATLTKELSSVRNRMALLELNHREELRAVQSRLDQQRMKARGMYNGAMNV